jgi:serine/threonine-protein kinase RsbW
MHGKSTRTARPGATLRLRIPPLPKYGKYVRERITALAEARGIAPTDVEEFVGAVSEALANAIEHSGTKSVEVTCTVSRRERLTATVVDHGVGFSTDAAVTRLPDPLAERGRGLPLMRRYTDRLSVTSSPDKGTAVTLELTIRHPVRIAG